MFQSDDGSLAAVGPGAWLQTLTGKKVGYSIETASLIQSQWRYYYPALSRAGICCPCRSFSAAFVCDSPNPYGVWLAAIGPHFSQNIHTGYPQEKLYPDNFLPSA